MAVSDWVLDSQKGCYVRDFSNAAKGVGLSGYKPTIFDPVNPRRDNRLHKFAFRLNQNQLAALTNLSNSHIENGNSPNVIPDDMISPTGSSVVSLPSIHYDALPIIDPMIAFYFATNPFAKDRTFFVKFLFSETSNLEHDDKVMNIDQSYYHFDDDSIEIDSLLARCEYMKSRGLACNASDMLIVSDVIGTEFVNENNESCLTQAGDVIWFNGLTKHKTPHGIGKQDQRIRTTVRLRFGDPLLFEPIIGPR